MLAVSRFSWRSKALLLSASAREDPSLFCGRRGAPGIVRLFSVASLRAVAQDPMAVLDDRPHLAREPSISLEARAKLVSLACRKAKDLGYPHERWTMGLLAGHPRGHRPAEGRGCLAHLILDQEEVKPHKVRYLSLSETQTRTY
jgi:hypothetical protein